jgi:hypothetical protein
MERAVPKSQEPPRAPCREEDAIDGGRVWAEFGLSAKIELQRDTDDSPRHSGQ